MSDLKHLSLDNLKRHKLISENAIQRLRKRLGKLNGEINNKVTRLEWIEHYIATSPPKEMTLASVEEVLGYKVKIISSE